MYGLDMYTTIKTLLSQGKSKRSIAKLLGINPRTVCKIARRIEAGKQGPDPVDRRGLYRRCRAESIVEGEWLFSCKAAFRHRRRLRGWHNFFAVRSYRKRL